MGDWALEEGSGSAVKNPPANIRGSVSIPDLGRSPGEGNENLLQYSCLENSMNRGTSYSPCTCQRVGQGLLTKQSQQHEKELTCDAEAQLKLETAMCDADISS